MTALINKATGWKTLEKETNQKPERHLEIVPELDCIDIYFRDQRQKEIKSINAAMCRREANKPFRAAEREAYRLNLAEEAKIERPRAYNIKDREYPERGDYPYEIDK